MTDESKSAERSCIATGEVLPKEKLIRFVVSPDGKVVPDLQGKLPGRGMWVSSTREALTLAVKKQLFSRAAKERVHASEDLPERVMVLLHSELLHLLAMARKAGVVITGFDAVSDALSKKEAKLLLMAEDARGDAQKVLRLLGETPLISVLSRDTLGKVTSRAETVYMVVTRADFAEKIMEKCHRYTGFIQKNAL